MSVEGSEKQVSGTINAVVDSFKEHFEFVGGSKMRGSVLWFSKGKVLVVFSHCFALFP